LEVNELDNFILNGKDNEIFDTKIERQKNFADKVRKINADFENKYNRKKTMFISTFGCQMNAHDSEKIYGMLKSMGFVEAKEEKNADFVIFNTCCVRENAENKVFGNLGFLKHAKQTNPFMKIALCGCMMQQENIIDIIRKKYRHVDIVFGTFNLYKLPELIYTNIETKSPVFDIWKRHGEIVEDLPAVRKYKFKACVNIMFGCDNFCSYCIVPYVRGRERSRNSSDIVNEIKNLVDDGVKEVTLLGQNVNSYGKNINNNIDFPALLRMVNDINGLERIRFMTSHPKDLSDELIFAMAQCEKVCGHIHLPFQAGSNRILKKMNRNYTKEKYLELVYKIKDKIPDIAVTTDIIVGFPGETSEDVDETIDVIKKAQFNGAFTFLYSKRTGTPAASMDNQVPEKEAKAQFNRVIEVLNNIVLIKNKEHIGKNFKVLAEEVSSSDRNFITGRLEDNSIVHFQADNSDIIGKIVEVEIVGCKTFYLIGKLK